MSKNISIALLILSTASIGYGHGATKDLIPQEGLTINSSVAVEFSNNSTVAENEIWNVPGFLMGGEALPRMRGLHLSSASISSSFRKGQLFAKGDATFHGHHSGIELESASVGYLLSEESFFEAGRLNGAFSPQNTAYRSSTVFVSPSLVYDVIWGRHYTDEGLRLVFEGESLHCGFEGWSGNRFPSHLGDDGKGAYDSYCRYQLEGSDWNFMMGGYYYNGSSGQREDERYSSEHSHGVDTETVPSYYFTGKTEVMGALLRGAVSFESFSLGIEAEVISSTSDGDLRDTTRLSPIVAKYQGLTGTLYAQVSSHTLSLRYDHLRYKNELEGAAASDLAELTGLVGNEDPIAISLAYANQFDENLFLKLEWVQRKYLIEDKESILCGLLWRFNKHI